MSPRRTLATAGRLLRQLRHDPSTLFLVFAIPCVLLTILKYVYQQEPQVYDMVAPMLLGIFPLVLIFVAGSVATLRDRNAGTLERLMVLPLSRLDLIFGYALAFAVVALVQASVACFFMLKLLGVHVLGGTLPLLLGAVLAALLGMALGLFLSAFARSEFQAVQFMPAVILPQFLTCGIFVPRNHMVRLLQWFADVMPLTYSVDAMKQITQHTTWTGRLTVDFVVVVIYALAALVLGAATIRRQE